MRYRTFLFILLSIFAKTSIYSQTFDSTIKSKILFRIYKGGRPKYSKVLLKLNSDSTYEYSNRYHFGQTENDKGTFLLTDTSIILYSNGFEVSKQRKLNSKYLFTGQLYKIQKEKLLLFTQKQEAEDNTDFYPLYFTLQRVK